MEVTEVKIKKVDLRHNKYSECRESAMKCIENNPYGYSTTSYSGYGNNSYNYASTLSDDKNSINCKFYEWSRIDDKTRQFFNMKELKDFFKECDIVLDKEDEDRIKRGYTWFITCTPGEKTLIISTTFYGLQCLLETAYKNKNLNVPKSYYSTLNY